jgi:hypothetical protein
MANYTVFGSGVPANTLTVFSDGSPNITVGNYFYTYGSNTSGWRCRGGRVYVPSDAATNSQPITIMAWVSTTTPVDMSTAPFKSVATTTQPAGGWVEVLWDTPFTINSGEFVFIAYAFGNPREAYYMHVASPSGTYIRSGDNVDLAFAEPNISTMSPVSGRGRFRQGTGSTGSTTAWYGSDIMVDDGALPTPIAEYGFNELSGITAADSSGNSHDLTVNSASNFNVGNTGNGLHQVGGGGANLISNTATWAETNHRTVMFWGRRGSEGTNDWSNTVSMQVSGVGSETVFGIFLNDNTGQVYFRVKEAGVNRDITAPEPSLGTWAHYALTYDRQYVRAYIDGTQVNEIAATGAVDASDGNLYLYGEDYQQQVIDDLRIFDVALTEEQIQTYMNDAIEPPDTTPPSVPANLSGNATYQQVTLNWDDSTDNVEMQNYFVYRSGTSGFTPVPGDIVGSPATSNFSQSAPVGTWYYRVSARDEAGNESAPCAEIEIITTQAPAAEEYLFPSDLGWSVGSSFQDPVGAGMSFGIICALSGIAEISGGRFYSPAVKNGAEVRLYADNVEVAVKTGVNLVVGWNELLFDTPYLGTSGVDYMISVFVPGPTVDYTTLANAFTGSQLTVGPMYTTLLNNSRYGNGSGLPAATSSSWYGVDIIAPNGSSPLDPTFGATVALENAKTGALGAEWTISGVGDSSNLGFARQFSVNAGETVQFSCHGTGTVLDIYRIGWYDGRGWRKVAELTNTATTQPDPQTIADSNGGVTCSNWSVTASWAVPNDAFSGLFVGVYRNLANDNASYIPFIVRNDSRTADVAYKTADSTWALAYNYYGTPASPLTGTSLYGAGGPLGSIGQRTHAVSYHRPIVTRGGVSQTYWLACEAPLIRFLERNGIDVKYIASRDLDIGTTGIDNTDVLVSSGHDEYWSIGMRDNAEAFRDAGGHLLFFSGNEVFWRTRFEPDRNTMWCYKDTMGGPGGHVAGTPLDPVSWTGTWKDTRFPGRKPENTITGTDFRMNGVNDYAAPLLQAADYASHPFWRNSALVSGNVTALGVIGFEADRMLPTQPGPSTAVLASHTLNIDGKYADDNGQEYAGNGDLDWGVVSQRYASGAVVVGFGTCQWSWALDATHDRGGNYVQPALQQATLNLFADLGALPATPIAGMTTPTPVSLDNYGVIPAGTRSGKVKVWDGSQWAAHPLKVWDGSAWVTRPVSGDDGSGFVVGKG